VTQILAATSISATSPYTVEYTPIDLGGSSSVTSTTAFIVQTDRLLLPESANRQSVCLQPLLDNVNSPAGCALGIYLAPAYDPIRREVTLRLTPDAAPLMPQTRYALTLYASLNPGDPGLLSFDGIGLSAPFQVEVGVLDNPPDALPPWNLPAGGDHFCSAPAPGSGSPATTRSVQQILLLGCGYNSCHGPDHAAEGLQLDSPEHLVGTAIGHVAHETLTGEIDVPQAAALRFGQSMALIDPGEPGSSYLLYKLLARRDLALEVPFAPAADPTADPPEVARLRNELVVGLPMAPDSPPPNATAVTPLQPGDAEWLSEWILEGAKTPACP
jgi:hypothetical protein